MKTTTKELPGGISVESMRSVLMPVAEKAFSGGIPDGWKILGFRFDEDYTAVHADFDEPYDASKPVPEMARVKIQTSSNYPGQESPLTFTALRREGKGIQIQAMEMSVSDEKGDAVLTYW